MIDMVMGRNRVLAKIKPMTFNKPDYTDGEVDR